MRYLSATELLSEEIDLHHVCVFPIREPLGHEGVFTDRKRHCNVLFLYLAGEREYVLENGERFSLTPHHILYVPQYATYRFRITKADDNGFDDAIAINFEMHDRHGDSVCLDTRPRLLMKDTLAHYLSRFQRALSIDTGTKDYHMPLKSTVYALLYDLLCELSLHESAKAPWRTILPAIDLIESLPAEDIPIPELAHQCGVSETRFRQLFKQYTGGESAVQYRNRLRLEQVERLLHTEQVTVEYAARKAGFHDMSHFYRLYKRRHT